MTRGWTGIHSKAHHLVFLRQLARPYCIGGSSLSSDNILYVPKSHKLEDIMQTKATRQNRVASPHRRPFEEQLNKPQTFSSLDSSCHVLFVFTLLNSSLNVGLQGFGLIEISALKLLPDLGVNNPPTQRFLYNAV